MTLETETEGVVADPTEDDIHRVFQTGAVVGHFIHLSRDVEDFLHVEFTTDRGDRPANWDDGIEGVYLYHPEYGRSELERWSEDGYRSGRYGGSAHQQLREMFLHYLRGPEAFDQWQEKWTGRFRGDC
jgi:hypothetical protein